MTQTRFTCTLTRADEPACQSYARVTIIDSQGDSGRACLRHAVAALDGISRGPHPRGAAADRPCRISPGRGQPVRLTGLVHLVLPGTAGRVQRQHRAPGLLMP
jgi:hypothetical protein